MGWKERQWFLDAEDVAPLFDRNGNAGPSIWIDGHIVGGWVQRKDGSIALGWFRTVPATRRRQVEAVAHRLEDILGDTRFTVRFPAPMQAELMA